MLCISCFLLFLLKWWPNTKYDMIVCNLRTSIVCIKAWYTVQYVVPLCHTLLSKFKLINEPHCCAGWHVPSLPWTHTVVYLDSVPCAPSWCPNYSLRQQMRINPPLKIVPNRCTFPSCLRNVWCKLQWPSVLGNYWASIFADFHLQ